MFDGVCNLCNGLVQFIIRRDPHARLHFAAMTSFSADTLVLLEHGRRYDRSDAVLRILRQLRAPWPLLFVFIVVPRPIRDWMYDVVARRRYRWFGRRETCMVPTPELRARFLETPPSIEYSSERGR